MGEPEEFLAAVSPQEAPFPPSLKGGREGDITQPQTHPIESPAVSRETKPGEDLTAPPLHEGREHKMAPSLVATDFGPADFAAELSVSRETMRRLAVFDALLLDACLRHNLIARSTIADRWRRHYLDGGQLFALLPKSARTLFDLGSGAGFPGLVLAALGAERGLQVTLVEATRKKAAFLAEAAGAMGLHNVAVLPERIESLNAPPPDAITARAVAPLAKLLDYAHGVAGKDTLCIFLKGLDVGVELTEASKSWHMEVETRDSVTNAGARILLVRKIAPKAPKGRRAKPE